MKIYGMFTLIGGTEFKNLPPKIKGLVRQFSCSRENGKTHTCVSVDTTHRTVTAYLSHTPPDGPRGEVKTMSYEKAEKFLETGERPDFIGAQIDVLLQESP